jgi:uncharacterized protein (DUF1015 family)
MQAGGRLRGWHVGTPSLVDQVVRGLRGLARQAAALPGAPPLLYAVGDGNHSLAAARAIWETTRARSGQDAAAHPARYALVELVNVHDQGLRFEPIHRVVQQVDVDDLLGALAGCCQRAGVRLRPSAPGSSAALSAAAGGVRYLAAGRQGAVLPGARQRLEPAALQGFLDAYAAAHSRARLDYIHGDQALAELAGRPDTVGFLLPALDKGELFPGVRRAGPFPRKTFSLGGADDKRFYLETRRVVP